jgi:peroxiredoxin (alkyl hydroperoxide reductase subunit C)
VVDDFELETVFKDKYAVLFFYPLDFTCVCPSEIIAMAHRTDHLRTLGCEVVGVSVDSHWTHNAYRNTSVEDEGIGLVPFDLASDMTREISNAYGILATSGEPYDPLGVSMRATFVIDRSGTVRHQVVNDEPVGRNMDDVVRVVEALQFFEENGQVCPAGWKKGDEGMLKDTRRCGELPRRECPEAITELRLEGSPPSALRRLLLPLRRSGTQIPSYGSCHGC